MIGFDPWPPEQLTPEQLGISYPQQPENETNVPLPGFRIRPEEAWAARSEAS
jgi:hypothetical protein